MSEGSRKHERASISSVVHEVMTSGGDPRAYCDYLLVRSEDAERIRAAGGPNVSGFSHAVDASAVRHIRNRHGPGGTSDQTVTADDLDRLPEIVGSPDELSALPPTKATRGLTTLVYRKQAGGNWLVVEEVRTGRKRLALVSMYKEKATAP